MNPAGTSNLGLEDRLLIRQMSDFISNVRSAAVGTLLSALIVLPLMARAEQAVFWACWVPLLLLLDGLRVHQTFDFDKTSTDPAYIRRNALYATSLATACGAHWAIAFVVLWQNAQSPGEFLTLCVLAAGIMSSALIQYRHLKPAAVALMLACMLAGTGIAFFYHASVAFPIVLLVWLHGIIVLRGVTDHARFYRARLIEEIELERSEQTVRLLLHEYEESASDWLFETNPAGRFQEISERFAEAAGRPADELKKTGLLDLFARGAERRELAQMIEAQQTFRNHVLPVVGKGRKTWWSVSAKPLTDGSLRGVMSDVSVEVMAEQRLSRMARNDTLTGLANRLHFNENLAQSVARVGAARTLMFIDLDKFKIVNDTLGHDTGDDLLVAAARRMTSECGRGDLPVRLGGDEFAILCAPKSSPKEVRDLADRLLRRLADPFRLAGKVVRVSASIGIAHVDGDPLEPEELMRQADLALYAAKQKGRGRWQEYNAELQAMERKRRGLELDLRQALAEDQFSLAFQPQIDFATGEPTGMEALLRWNHPEHGLVMPDEFIGLAEESGLLVAIGEWVANEAIRTAAKWERPLTIALNLSPVQIRSEGFVEVLTKAIAVSGIAPGRVELEITETALLHDTDENVRTLHRLRALGVRIALDDFGTGYSSLNYLRSFPFDTIKIDRCFVEDLMDRPDCQAIIRATINLAQELDMETVAEGIETAEQFEWLGGIDCTAGQGYYISRPIACGEQVDAVARQETTLQLDKFALPPSSNIRPGHFGMNVPPAAMASRV